MALKAIVSRSERDRERLLPERDEVVDNRDRCDDEAGSAEVLPGVEFVILLSMRVCTWRKDDGKNDSSSIIELIPSA